MNFLFVTGFELLPDLALSCFLFDECCLLGAPLCFEFMHWVFPATDSLKHLGLGLIDELHAIQSNSWAWCCQILLSFEFLDDFEVLVDAACSWLMSVVKVQQVCHEAQEFLVLFHSAGVVVQDVRQCVF